VINGLISVPILAAMTAMASTKRVMGHFVIPRALRYAGWFTTSIMGLCSVALIIQMI